MHDNQREHRASKKYQNLEWKADFDKSPFYVIFVFKRNYLCHWNAGVGPGPVSVEFLRWIARCSLEISMSHTTYVSNASSPQRHNQNILLWKGLTNVSFQRTDFNLFSQWSEFVKQYKVECRRDSIAFLYNGCLLIQENVKHNHS